MQSLLLKVKRVWHSKTLTKLVVRGSSPGAWERRLAAKALPLQGSNRRFESFRSYVMKQCSACKEVKPFTQFHKRTKSRDGYQSRCKVCNIASRLESYHCDPANKAATRLSAKINRDRNQKFVWSYLEQHPCVDCAEDDIVVLQFDHVRGTKENSIANMMRAGYSVKKIEKEIAKCDVRCANCHAKRTAKQFGWLKSLQLNT